MGCHLGTHTLYLASYGMHEFIGIDACKESIDCLNLSIKKNGLKIIKAVHAGASHSNFKCAFSTRTHEDSQLWQDVGFWKCLWMRKELKRMIGKRNQMMLGIYDAVSLAANHAYTDKDFNYLE